MSEEKLFSVLDANHDQLISWLKSHGQPAFRAKQIMHWIHHQGVVDFSAMHNISKKLQQLLEENAVIKMPKITQTQQASDGCLKWLLRLEDGNVVEVVYIPEEKVFDGVLRRRATLCVSSQAGCTLNCTFCATGKQGFNRNLSAGEIISQLWIARDALKKSFAAAPKITNVVFMGMGEPLLNYDAVVFCAKLMIDDQAYGLSKYRITISTSGVLPAMQKLKDDVGVSFALSLHAANDELRNELVPINRKYNLQALMECCKNYFIDSSLTGTGKSSKRKILMEYVMLKGVNDTPKHAKQLINLLAGIPCKINLIPFNPFPHTEYECSDDDVMQAFQDKLIKSGFNTRLRKTRGSDMAGACGQLAGQVKDRTGRNAKFLRDAAASAN